MIHILDPGLATNIMGRLQLFEEFAKANQERAAQVFIKQLRKNLSQKGSGRMYPSRRTPGKKHQASAPGEPPAPDTRTLMKSARVGKRETFPWGRRIRVQAGGEKAPYAVPLEFGSRARNLAPRPFFRPTLIMARPGMKMAMDQTGAGLKISTAIPGLTKRPSFSTLLGRR